MMNPQIEPPDEIDTIKARVEKILNRLMRLEIHLYRNDPRIISIHNDIHKDYAGKNRKRISDEEMMEYVKKYYRFRAVVGETGTS